MSESEIHKIIQSEIGILKIKYHLSALPKSSLEKIESLVLQKIINNPNLNREQIAEHLEKQLQKCIVQTFKKNVNSKYSELILNGYMFLYHRINEILKIEENENSLTIFRECIVKLLERNRYSDTELLIIYKKEILNYLNAKKPNKKRELSSERITPAEKTKYLLEKTFEGDIQILYFIVSALEEEERTWIRSIKNSTQIEDLNKNQKIENKIKIGIRFYFMLCWKNLRYVEANEELKRILLNQKFQYQLKKYQQKFYESLQLPQTMIQKELEELRKNNKERYDAINIFLGNTEYQAENQDYILQETQSWIQEITNKEEKYIKENSLFAHFPKIPREHIRLIVSCFKNEEPIFYLILIKYYGESLCENFEITVEETKLLQDAIDKIKEILIKEKRKIIKIDEKERIFLKRNNRSLYSKFPNEDKELIGKIVKYLKEDYPQYYEIIIARHGENLLSWNKLPTSQNMKYYDVLKKIRNILFKIKSGELKIDENKLKIDKSLYAKFPEEKKELIEKIVEYLKENYLQYYEVIIARHDKDILGWNPLSQSQNLHYQDALKKIKNIIARINSGEIKISDNKLNIDRSLFSKFPNENKELIEKAVKYLKENDSEYYEIIIARHDKDLLGWNPLSQSQNHQYQDALRRINNILNKIKSDKVKIFDNKLKINRDLYSRFPEEKNSNRLATRFQDEELMLKVLEKTREINPEYYQSFIKYNQDNLDENHILSQQEKEQQNVAIDFIHQELKETKKRLKAHLQETLIENKKELVIIKEKRRGLETNIIAQKYRLKEEEIYRIYANNIMLFGSLIPTIIEEILSESDDGFAYLVNSKSFQCLLNNISKETILSWKQKILQENKKLSENQKQLIKTMIW